MQYYSGEGEELQINSDHDIKTQETFLNWYGGGIDYKHLYWNDDKSSYKIKRNFKVKSNKDQVAWFEKLDKTITIRNDFYGNDGGEIEIKDPWWIEDPATFSQPNRFVPYSSPFTPGRGNFSDYLGIFLNKEFNIPGNLFYKLLAELEQEVSFHGENITCYFLGWEGTDVEFEYPEQQETAVVFKYSNAEARARYKGHLASNTSKTLLNNSQRKIVFDGERYHLAYVDNGEVYYTYFNNTAGEWERDVRISHGEGGCAFPAISAVRNGEDNYVMVVWQEFNDSYHGVYSRMKVNDTWYTPREVKYINSDYYEATPVVDYLNGYFHILWRDFENYYPLWTEKNLKVRPSNIINQQFGEIVSIAETDKYSLHPSMASDDAGHLHIAWEESGQIYYVALRYSDNEYDYFTDKECVSA